MFPTPYVKAAALMEGIIKNHPFADGNKRTAFLAGARLLQMLAGKDMKLTVKEGVEVGKAVAEGRINVAELAAWFEAHSA
jgi:death-on-curing protein